MLAFAITTGLKVSEQITGPYKPFTVVAETMEDAIALVLKKRSSPTHTKGIELCVSNATVLSELIIQTSPPRPVSITEEFNKWIEKNREQLDGLRAVHGEDAAMESVFFGGTVLGAKNANSFHGSLP